LTIPRDDNYWGQNDTINGVVNLSLMDNCSQFITFITLSAHFCTLHNEAACYAGSYARTETCLFSVSD